jgi:hypothetical protein
MANRVAILGPARDQGIQDYQRAGEERQERTAIPMPRTIAAGTEAERTSMPRTSCRPPAESLARRGQNHDGGDGHKHHEKEAAIVARSITRTARRT